MARGTDEPAEQFAPHFKRCYPPPRRSPVRSIRFDGRTGGRGVPYVKKTILILTPYSYGEVPGPRSSIELWEKVLEPEGIRFEYSPFETTALREVIYERGKIGAKAFRLLDAYARRLASLRSLDRYDGVLVYREAALVGPALVERIAARRKPIIYQLDDPLYVPYRSPSNGWFYYEVLRQGRHDLPAEPRGDRQFPSAR